MGKRTKNATRNIISGVVLKLVQIVVMFIMRTAIIRIMGIEYLGLNSLFSSILQVLSLTELGVGAAMVYSMYKPVAIKDEESICALLNLYKKYYKIIGIVILIIGLSLTPFINILIRGSSPKEINIYYLYLLNLLITVISYLLFSYRSSLLLAHQRIDILNKIYVINTLIQYSFQILVLYLFHNYYLYTIVNLLSQILLNITIYLKTKEKYPNYKPVGNINEETKLQINKKIKDLFISKLAFMVDDSTGTIVISSLISLTLVAIYQNYLYILKAISGFITIALSAILAVVGNSLAVENKQKNYEDFSRLTFIICWLVGFCSICILCLVQPFMELWVGQKYLLAFPAVVCFVIYFYAKSIYSLFNTYKDASGIWNIDKYRALIVSIVNIILNIILAKKFGVYGILCANTVTTCLISCPWIVGNLFLNVFEKEQIFIYLKKFLKFSIVIAINCFICYLICLFIKIDNLYLLIVVRFIIVSILSNTLFYLVYRKTDEFIISLRLIDIATKGKIRSVLKLIDKRVEE